MLQAESSITVTSSGQDLYEFITNPANLASLLLGSQADVQEVTPLPGGGYTYRWVFTWAGFPIWAQAGTTELVPYERVVIESVGGIDTTATWTFKPVNGGTRITLAIRAREDSLLMRRISSKIVGQQLRATVDSSLANMKVIAAALAPAPMAHTQPDQGHPEVSTAAA